MQIVAALYYCIIFVHFSKQFVNHLHRVEMFNLIPNAESTCSWAVNIVIITITRCLFVEGHWTALDYSILLVFVTLPPCAPICGMFMQKLCSSQPHSKQPWTAQFQQPMSIPNDLRCHSGPITAAHSVGTLCFCIRGRERYLTGRMRTAVHIFSVLFGKSSHRAKLRDRI